MKDIQILIERIYINSSTWQVTVQDEQNRVWKYGSVGADVNFMWASGSLQLQEPMRSKSCRSPSQEHDVRHSHSLNLLLSEIYMQNMCMRCVYMTAVKSK